MLRMTFAAGCNNSREVKNNTANINRLSERVDQFVQNAEADREVIASAVRGISVEVHFHC